MTIAQINSFCREEFVERLGRVYENSPWVAERAWGRRPNIYQEQQGLSK
jgi:2-oxo-4-hydroxy-4-carboxy-5-ureidoimidazoline decarboxylase